MTPMAAESPSAVEVVTPSLLRGWPLPAAADSKYGRGAVVVIGGAARTPGAAVLAGLAVLRVGAGHLTLAVSESTAVPMAVSFPESGVVGLPQDDKGSVRGADLSVLSKDIGRADVVLVGPGLDDADLTAELLQNMLPLLGDDTRLVLDAYALGAMPGLPELAQRMGGKLILTPNSSEAERLLGRPLDQPEADLVEIADRYSAVVSCQNLVADPEGHRWRIGSGQEGLATSGSGDVLAGTVAGLLARGAEPAQAACWGTHLHSAAGDRLASRVGVVGFLARELLTELPLVLVELSST